MEIVAVRAFPTMEERDKDVRDNAIYLGQTTDPHRLGRLLNSGTETHRYIGYYVNDKPLGDLELAMRAVGAHRRGDWFYDSRGMIIHC